MFKTNFTDPSLGGKSGGIRAIPDILQAHTEAEQRNAEITRLREDPGAQREFVDAILKKGLGLLESSHYQEAIECLQEAKIIIGQLGNAPKDVSRCVFGLATALRELRRYDEAEALYQELIQTCAQLPTSEENINIKSNSLRSIGIYYLTRKNYPKAIEVFQEAENTSAQLTSLRGFQLAVANYVALSLGLNRQFDESLKKFAEVSAHWSDFPASERDVSMDYGSHLYHYGRIHYKTAKKQSLPEQTAISHYESAILFLKDAISLRERHLAQQTNIGPEYRHSRIADPTWQLGKTYIELAHLTQQEEMFALGTQLLEKARVHYAALQNTTKVDKISRKITALGLFKATTADLALPDASERSTVTHGM